MRFHICKYDLTTQVPRKRAKTIPVTVLGCFCLNYSSDFRDFSSAMLLTRSVNVDIQGKVLILVSLRRLQEVEELPGTHRIV